jgi:DNA-binding PadR family transcriptional regulator
MGIREGLVTLLARKPAHGYQLKLDLEAAVGDTWTVNVGQIYTTLQRLERDGLVESSGMDEQKRIIYRATAPGRAAARAWLAEPEELAAANRDEVTLKVLLALTTGVESARRVVEIQRGATMAGLQDYTSLKATADDDLGWQLYLDRLILNAEAELRWLERVEARIESLPAKAAAPVRRVEAHDRAGVRQ